MEDLYNALSALRPLFGQVFLIFDALNECDPETRRKGLLPLFRRMKVDHINIFLTSWPYSEDIQASLHDTMSVKLSAHTEDIGVYITEKIEEHPRARRLVKQGDCKDTIISKLVDCAGGM